jgi:hypothetical protein
LTFSVFTTSSSDVGVYYIEADYNTISLGAIDATLS